ncbi:MAG: MSCRAMM family protein, partial [Verrucomicrobiales bacterium]
MNSEAVHQATAYRVEGDNEAAFVQIQPGGRVALVTLRKPIGGLLSRKLTVGPEVKDVRGASLGERSMPILADYRNGVDVVGRVIRADGSPAVNIPVTLTYEDEYQTRDGCGDWTRRVAQTVTDSNGRFNFDFVLGGIAFVLSATDTSGLNDDEIEVILEATVAGNLQKDDLASLFDKAGAAAGLFGENNAAAIAKAEGVDRAAFNDLIDPLSRRSATTLPVVLTFRGRATVTGHVLASDGVTAVAEAAVNLFPDPASRELGRGVFSDAEGRFAFFGVPLGAFSLEVMAPSGQGRIVSDAVSRPGEVRDVPVVLSSSRMELGSLAGRVLESDNLTPHAGARVFVKTGDIAVRSTTADADGLWQVNGLQARAYNLAAISQDLKRSGQRLNVAAVAGFTNFVEIPLNGTATVRGRVLTSSGDRPVANALIAGGDVLARTDENGFFTVTGVPTGKQTISAGVERSEEGFPPKSSPAFDFPRFGSASLNVLPGADNFVIIQLTPAARVLGRVFNADGTPKAGAMICMPQDEGFFFIHADDFGRFVWENLPVGKRLQFSVPGELPPVNDTTVPSAEQVAADPAAALTGALAVLMGLNDPFLNGAGANFASSTFDAKAVTLQFDGESRELVFTMRAKGSVSGQVLNGQGVPIGAAVRVTGEGLSANMAPTIVVRGDANSDPASGLFSYDGIAVGNIQLQAASPFFPMVISVARNTTSTEPNATNVILQFPPAAESQGRLAGKVFEPNGITPVGEGVKVGINFKGLLIETESDGTFDTRFGLPAPASYQVTVTNLTTGLVGQGVVNVVANGTNSAQNFINVRLLGKGGLQVQVIDFAGNIVPGALVRINGGSFPHEDGEGRTLPSVFISFEGLSEGNYALVAEL